MQTEDIVTKVKLDDAAITSKMLKELVNEHRSGRGQDVASFEARYKQQQLPIQTRIVKNPNKVDERIPNDFFSDIIDTKQGYMGNEVTVELEDGEDGQNKVLHDFHILNDSVDQNSEMVKSAARDGVGYRLLYVPEGRNEVRLKQIPASEVVLFKDASLDVTTFALRYWYVEDITYAGAIRNVNKRTVVEWYDAEYITYYIDDGRGEYVIDSTKGKEGQQPHLFDGVPVIEFRNNEEGIGEAEKVINLIDAYDTITSATVSEIEQFRLAYMLAKDIGGEVDNELLKTLEQTGIFPVGPNGDVKFITKDLAIEGVKTILDELRVNIYQFARSIDLSKDYGGDLRVIGWQVALLNLENSCKVTERKFKRGLREQYRLVTQKWAEWGKQIDYLDLTFSFTRNFPKDTGSEAKTLLDLVSTISRKSAYELMSFIDDPEAELEAVKEDGEFFGADMLGSDEEEPEGATAEGLPVTEDVQAQALNGAQIKSVVDIASLVAQKQLPPETGRSILKVAIPSLSDADAASIINPASNFKVNNVPENGPAESDEDSDFPRGENSEGTAP